MDIKHLVKSACGAVCCRIAGAKAGKGMYVGTRVNIVNGRNCVVAGAPAKVIKRFDFDSNTWVRDAS